ncbi:MAG TPA: type II/IV secretion system protein, partial [Usitatibacter sp.]|nr:type II/IV secretion system protein [Usitatibacter sp.]
MASVSPSRVDRKLQLKEVLDWLVADGLVDAEMAGKMTNDARFARGTARHPLVVIGEARLRSKVAPGPFLTADALTEWLAARLKMPSYRIDPLKIDLKSVTQVMSSDYAQKRGILPVEVSGKDVTIATSEPMMTAWEGELAQMLRLNIKRVLANPVDIERYQ